MSKKGNGEGSIFKMKNGKWRAVMSLGYDDSGKRIRKYRTFSKRADASAALDQMRSEETLTVHKSGGMTVGECLDMWLAVVVTPNCAANTLTSYTRVSNSHIKPLIGGISLKAFEPLHVQKMLAKMKEEGYGARSRQLAYVVLNACMRKFVELRKILYNPCSAVERPAYEREEILPFTDDEARRILDESNGTRFHALFYLALSCGMRQGELLGLRWDRVNLDDRTLMIDQQAVENSSSKVEYGRPKTKASIRTVSIPLPAVAALKRHRAVLMQSGLAGNELIFPAMHGGFQAKSYLINRVWKKLLGRLGIQYRGFHHLRHTYATLSLGANVPVHVVAKVMGHSSPSITLKTYAHLLPKDQAYATEAITNILAGGCSVAARKRKKSS